MFRLSEDEKEKIIKKSSWWCFFLFHWLWPCGDRATIKLLNSWRQGWNWTELPVTWLPLPNDNLGFNQKKPLSAWLIQKLRWRTPRSARGRLFVFTSLSAQFILLSPLQSSPLSYKMCFLRMADAHYYREGAQPRVRGFVHSSFSYCLRMSVENAPATQTHTDTQAHTHTPVAIHIARFWPQRWNKNLPPNPLKKWQSGFKTEINPKQFCVQWLRTPHRRNPLKVRYNEICSASVDMCCNKKIIHYGNTDGYDKLRPFLPITAVWHTDKVQELVHRSTRMHVHSDIVLLQTFRDTMLELISNVF